MVKIFFALFLLAYILGIWQNAYSLEIKLIHEKEKHSKSKELIKKIQTNNTGLKNQIRLDQKEIEELKKVNDSHQYESALMQTTFNSFIYSLPIKYIKEFQEKKNWLESEFNPNEHRRISGNQDSEHKTNNS